MAVIGVGVIAAAGLVGVMAAPAGAEPLAYAIEDDLDCRLVQVDLATGAVTPIGPFAADACVDDLAIAPDGTLYGVLENDEQVELVRFDTTSGVPTVVGPIDGAPSGLADGGLTFAADGTMYAQMVTPEPGCDSDFVCLYRVDPANPAGAVFIGPVPQFQTEYYGLATSCSGETVSVRGEEEAGADEAFGDDQATDGPAADEGDAGDVATELDEPSGFLLDAQFLTTVDTGDGSTSDVGPVGDANFVASLDFDAAGTLWGVGLTSEPFPQFTVFTIDPATGQATATVPIGDEAGDTELLALAIARDCNPPAPIVLEPTFTG